MIDLLLPTISQGLLWSILALGVYITYRVLDIADLTVECSFPLGAAVAASLLVKGWNPWTAILVAAVAGGLSGVVTGLLHTKLKIPALLAGILTMIALYSVNLRIMGKANLSLLGTATMFSSNETPAQDYQLARKLNVTINLDDITHIAFLEKVASIPETISCRFNPGGEFAIANNIMDNPGDAKYGMLAARAPSTEAFLL